MRNIFDQYSQPENQVTHALVSCLREDRALMRRFIKDIAKSGVPKGKKITIQEQTLPGEPEPTEKEADRRGLPDAILCCDERWCLAIESKISATPKLGQLRRHRATLERRGFSCVELLLITACPPKPSIAAECRCVTWSTIYAWLHMQWSKSDWAYRAAEYFEIQERRLIESGYLKEGALTEFFGFDFGTDRPYNYLEAKRVLRLALVELRKVKALRRQLGADLSGVGRNAITGRDATSVWDFIPLQGASGDRHTKNPHLTLSIRSDRVYAHVTIPHGISTHLRNNLLSLGMDRFLKIVIEVEQRLHPVLQSAPGAAPWLMATQRRYRSQRSIPIVDALLEFDLRTMTSKKKPSQRFSVKAMPEWVEAAFSALSTKRSTGANYQLSVGAIFPFDHCTAIRQPDAIRLIADTWLACKPLLSTVLRGK